MRFLDPLIRGALIRRYKRFLDYAAALVAARAAGVEVLCRSCRLTTDAIELDRAVPLDL